MNYRSDPNDEAFSRIKYRDNYGSNYIYNFNQEDKEFYYFLKAIFIAHFDRDELATCIEKILNIIDPQLKLETVNICLRG